MRIRTYYSIPRNVEIVGKREVNNPIKVYVIECETLEEINEVLSLLTPLIKKYNPKVIEE